MRSFARIVARHSRLKRRLRFISSHSLRNNLISNPINNRIPTNKHHKATTHPLFPNMVVFGSVWLRR